MTDWQRRLAWVAAGLVALVLAPATVVVGVPSVGLSLVRTLELSRAGMDEHRVEVVDLDWAYLRGGSGRRALMIHGYAADKGNWVRLAAHLTDQTEVIAPDLPGHGQTTRDPESSYDIGAQVARLKAFHDALDLGRVHLVGNSMGGHISVAYALAHPRDVLSVALIDPAGVVTPRPSFVKRAMERGENPLVVDSVADYDRLLDVIFVEPPFIPYPIKAYLAEQSVKHRAFNQKIMADLNRTPLPLEPVLPSLVTETLVLWGREDKVIDPSGAEVFDRLLPRSRLVLLDEAGHAPMIERPAEVAAHLTGFWAEVERSASR